MKKALIIIFLLPLAFSFKNVNEAAIKVPPGTFYVVVNPGLNPTGATFHVDGFLLNGEHIIADWEGNYAVVNGEVRYWVLHHGGEFDIWVDVRYDDAQTIPTTVHEVLDYPSNWYIEIPYQIGDIG